MAPDLGDYWWVPILAAGVSGFLIPILGYYRRPRNGSGAQSATIHGSTVIDSSVARDVLAKLSAQCVVLERLADAAEALLEVERGRDKRKAAELHHSEIETLRREIDDLKQQRGKR